MKAIEYHEQMLHLHNGKYFSLYWTLSATKGDKNLQAPVYCFLDIKTLFTI